jgi:hypothetical protein
MPVREEAVLRFWPKVERRGDTECWEWTGHKNPAGYGNFWADDRLVKAHRWAYETCVGPIAEGLTIDHLCRNTSCVNPAHLEAVTGWENTSRGSSPTAVHARQTHCKFGHPFDEENTQWRGPRHRICRTCNIAKARAWRLRRKSAAE